MRNNFSALFFSVVVRKSLVPAISVFGYHRSGGILVREAFCPIYLVNVIILKLSLSTDGYGCFLGCCCPQEEPIWIVTCMYKWDTILHSIATQSRSTKKKKSKQREINAPNYGHMWMVVSLLYYSSFLDAVRQQIKYLQFSKSKNLDFLVNLIKSPIKSTPEEKS